LAADALARDVGESIAGCCFISPNFGLRHKVAQALLDMPASTTWAPYLIGQERNFPVLNADHAQFWTTRYPTKAVKPMAEAVRAVRGADLKRIKVPVLMAINPDDQVISPRKADNVIARWGGQSEKITLTQTPDDDDMGHVMAGDVFSPGQTRPLADKIIAWAKNL
jgi:pimeloyl-ACP methyl ester carboxylesterase